MILAVLPGSVADLGRIDITWLSNYSWFIGCGLGFGLFVLFERRNPQVPSLEGLRDGRLGRHSGERPASHSSANGERRRR